ncbi:MAG: caspase family protein [Deltaproteobacteria bacterium]|nr:caspase family protein [Deltaproteobacteria bacterium]
MLRIIFLVLFILIIPIGVYADDCDDAAQLIESGNRVFEKDINKAYGFYDTALKLCPASPDIHYNMGLAYLKTNNLDRAASEFKKTIELKPEHEKAYTNLVYILIEKGKDISKGITIAENRLKAKQDPKLMALLSMGLYRQGKNADAVKWMLKASSNDPSNKDKYEALLQQMVAGKSLPTVAEVSSVPLASPADEKLPSLRPDTYAVIIGIDYKGRQDIPNLQYPSQDAKKVYEILTDARYGGVPKENTTLLLNEDATKNKMIAGLRKIKNWDGYIYVYFSGHGAPKTKEGKFVDAFLVPSDVEITDPEVMEDTSIKISYLQELIDSSQAKGVMVALDACFTGGGKSIVPKGGKPLVLMGMSPELIKPKGTGKVIITSSAANQQSWEDDKEIKGGIFSHYLLEGLKGKAGKEVWIKVDELADYIKNSVPKMAKRLKGQEQNPIVSGKGDFAVARNWDMAKVLDADMAKTRLKAAFEKGIISEEQLNKAMDELKTQKRSRTLKSFLEGKIDEKKFGELY